MVWWYYGAMSVIDVVFQFFFITDDIFTFSLIIF